TSSSKSYAAKQLSGRWPCTLGVAFLAPALFLAGRFVLLAIAGESAGHLHSVVVSGILVAAGLLSLAAGIISYLCSVNRRMLEELSYRERLREPTITHGARIIDSPRREALHT
ncbi:MAG: hypothetical protein WCJ09_12150, partial [Planctomycetota bacterium]